MSIRSPLVFHRILHIGLVAVLFQLAAGTAQAQRGGFDPQDFLSRMDRNGNGLIDPDEQEGPAKFMIQRMQSLDPSIKPGQPIPLAKFTEAFEKMRQQRGGDDGGRSSGGDRGDRSRSDRGSDDRSRSDQGGDDRGRSSSRPVDPMQVEPLVPGFGIEQPLAAMRGFGPSAEIMAVVPIEADFVQAREILARYDRDKDGQLSQEEIGRGRFWGTPMEFDRNGDGKLSESELATRQAVRRRSEEGSQPSRGDERKRSEPAKTEAIVEDFQNRRSYRVYAATAPEGVPRFFTERDLNQDGQISMSEYTSEWTDSLIAEFYAWDQNQDGVITVQEVLAGVNKGLTASDARPGVSPQSDMRASSTSDSSTATSAATAATPAAEKLQMPSEPPSQKMMDLAKKIISRYDTNGDMALTASEWSKMLISPADADFDGDGRVTVLEYAAFMTAKANRGK